MNDLKKKINELKECKIIINKKINNKSKIQK